MANNGLIKFGSKDNIPSTVNTTGANGATPGTYYLAQNPTVYEIQRSNNFEFYVDGLALNARLTGIMDSNDAALAHPDEAIRLSVTKSSVPHFSQSAIQVKRGNNTMKFAGVPEFKAGTITVNDFIGSGTKDVLMAWQQMSYDVNTEKVGLASDYKVTAYLLEYTPDYQLVRTWRLEGCWISEITEDEYNYEDNNKHTINVTIEYDKAYMETNNP